MYMIIYMKHTHTLKLLTIISFISHLQTSETCMESASPLCLLQCFSFPSLGHSKQCTDATALGLCREMPLMKFQAGDTWPTSRNVTGFGGFQVQPVYTHLEPISRFVSTTPLRQPLTLIRQISRPSVYG